MHKFDKERCKRLYQAILSLETVEECESFFEDACTYQEIEAITQRLEVAVMLDSGKSYIDINKATGASTATICRVSRALNYGKGGYKTVIDRTVKEN